VDTHLRHLTARGTSIARSANRAVSSEEQAVTTLAHRLALLPSRRLEAEDLRVTQWRRLLGAYDYQRQLDRGYSVTRGADGTVIRSTGDVQPGAVLTTRVSDGEVASTVTGTSPPAGSGLTPDQVAGIAVTTSDDR
jgi:exodeoxyribonuclease VII large subunit